MSATCEDMGTHASAMYDNLVLVTSDITSNESLQGKQRLVVESACSPGSKRRPNFATYCQGNGIWLAGVYPSCDKAHKRLLQLIPFLMALASSDIRNTHR